MKKITVLDFTKFLYILFGIGTIITFFIVYRDMEGTFAFRFVMGYMFLTFFLLIYTAVVTVLKLRRLEWIDIKKILLKLISSFIIFSALSFAIDYLFRASNFDLYEIFSRSFALAIGTSFIDVVLSRNQQV